jgi:hypothetical protein
MGAFMIALAADAPPGDREYREHKSANAREYSAARPAKAKPFAISLCVPALFLCHPHCA